MQETTRHILSNPFNVTSHRAPALSSGCSYRPSRQRKLHDGASSAGCGHLSIPGLRDWLFSRWHGDRAGKKNHGFIACCPGAEQHDMNLTMLLKSGTKLHRPPPPTPPSAPRPTNHHSRIHAVLQLPRDSKALIQEVHHRWVFRDETVLDSLSTFATPDSNPKPPQPQTTYIKTSEGRNPEPHTVKPYNSKTLKPKSQNPKP